MRDEFVSLMMEFGAMARGREESGERDIEHTRLRNPTWPPDPKTSRDGTPRKKSWW